MQAGARAAHRQAGEVVKPIDSPKVASEREQQAEVSHVVPRVLSPTQEEVRIRRMQEIFQDTLDIPEGAREQFLPQIRQSLLQKCISLKMVPIHVHVHRVTPCPAGSYWYGDKR